MGKDSKGINRGKCSKSGCDCVDFLYKEDKGIKCSICGHVPIAHAEIRFEILKPPDGFLESASEDEIDDEVIEEEVIEEETYEDVNLSHQPAGSSMDIRGTLRGECTITGCRCGQFTYIAQQGPKCSGCGHAPAKHTAEGGRNMPKIVNKIREEDEIERDSVPPQLFIKPQNRTFSSPLRSSFNTSVSDLSIADMEEEEDPTNSQPVVRKPRVRSKRRLLMKHEPDPIRSRYAPMDSSSSGPYSTSFPQSIPPNHPTIDSSMVPVYNQTAAYQHNTVFPAQANLATQNLAGFHTLQQRQPFAMPTNSMPMNSMAMNSMTTNSMATNSMTTNATFTAPAQPPPPVQPPPQTIPQPPVQQQKICKLDGCNKPVYVENGRVHDFCGRRHAVASKAAGIPANLKCSNPSCARMKYQENGKYLDFCGRSCRDSYRKLQQQLPAPSAGPQVSPANACLLPGCKLQKYLDSKTNTYFDYCGKNHALQAQKTLIKKASRQEFDRINAHFTKQWHPRKGACGQLHEVLVITNFKLKNQFEKYRSSLSVNTVSQHYHGTGLKCAIYQSYAVCSDETCGICGVCQKGMLPNFKATNIKFQRFGNGFYLAPNSSKCHDYTRGCDKYRAMLLFDVAEGKKYVVTNDQTTLKAPPQGYDSVYGQSGSALNYDEIVLYKSEALLPTHILVYMKDGIHKIAK